MNKVGTVSSPHPDPLMRSDRSPLPSKAAAMKLSWLRLLRTWLATSASRTASSRRSRMRDEHLAPKLAVAVSLASTSRDDPAAHRSQENRAFSATEEPLVCSPPGIPSTTSRDTRSDSSTENLLENNPPSELAQMATGPKSMAVVISRRKADIRARRFSPLNSKESASPCPPHRCIRRDLGQQVALSLFQRDRIGTL